MEKMIYLEYICTATLEVKTEHEWLAWKWLCLYGKGARIVGLNWNFILFQVIYITMWVVCNISSHKKIALFEKKKLLILVNCLSFIIKIYMNNDYAKWEHVILCCIKIVACVPSLVLNILSRTQQWYLSL